MIVLQTGSHTDNDKRKKHHQYTLNEAFQAVWEFNDERDSADLSDQDSA